MAYHKYLPTSYLIRKQFKNLIDPIKETSALFEVFEEIICTFTSSHIKTWYVFVRNFSRSWLHTHIQFRQFCQHISYNFLFSNLFFSLVFQYILHTFALSISTYCMQSKNRKLFLSK